MRVYAIPLDKHDKTYRLKTLLQFGESTKLIGSAVLMNPGSSHKISAVDLKTKEMITRFFKENHQIENVEEWHEYSVDPTMQWIEKIFNGWYILPQGTKIELNGIIQLFNCFYYRNPNKEIAKAEFASKSDNSIIFNEHHYIKQKPVYFGWGNDGKTVYREIASNIFNHYMNSKTENFDFYISKFDNNKFTHPRGVQLHSKNMQEYLKHFFSLLEK